MYHFVIYIFGRVNSFSTSFFLSVIHAHVYFLTYRSIMYTCPTVLWNTNSGQSISIEVLHTSKSWDPCWGTCQAPGFAYWVVSWVHSMHPRHPMHPMNRIGVHLMGQSVCCTGDKSPTAALYASIRRSSCSTNSWTVPLQTKLAKHCRSNGIS